jgi:hypothetical protein
MMRAGQRASEPLYSPPRRPRTTDRRTR